MIDINEVINCAFTDWSEPAIVQSSDEEQLVIYDDGTKLAQLGFSSYNNTAGFLLIHPENAQYFKRKDKVKLTESDKIVIIENIIKEKGGVLKAELSFYSDDEVFDDVQLEY